jgi:hypothetical protein
MKRARANVIFSNKKIGLRIEFRTLRMKGQQGDHHHLALSEAKGFPGHHLLSAKTIKALANCNYLVIPEKTNSRKDPVGSLVITPSCWVKQLCKRPTFVLQFL